MNTINRRKACLFFSLSLSFFLSNSRSTTSSSARRRRSRSWSYPLKTSARDVLSSPQNLSYYSPILSIALNFSATCPILVSYPPLFPPSLILSSPILKLNSLLSPPVLTLSSPIPQSYPSVLSYRILSSPIPLVLSSIILGYYRIVLPSSLFFL